MTRIFALLTGTSFAFAVPALAAAGVHGASTTTAQPGPAVAPVTGGPGAVAPPAVVGPSGETGWTRPRYTVEATSFKVLNETGWDAWGSDELIVRYLANNQSMFTGIYGSADTGETHEFRSQQRCISLAVDADNIFNHTWQCDPSGRAGPIAFTIEFFEFDGFLRGMLTEPLSFCLNPPSDLNIGCDDRRLQSLIIGRGQATYTEAELAAAMPSAGSYITRMVPIGTSHQVNVRITRTNSAVIAPPEVVVPTPVPPISLQATVTYMLAGARVTLTWSGATATTVDIYRDGALLTTQQNTGSYSRLQTPGTYLFRVCNAGSTVCSNDVSVTVNP